MATEAAALKSHELRYQHLGQRSFFLFTHALLLTLVLVGFGRTFYLRAFFALPPMPASLYAHGALLTTWFVLALAQSSLMRLGQVRWHRRLGIVGATLAVLVVLSGLVANHRMASSIVSTQDPRNIIVWGNYFTLMVFVGLVTAAILLRRSRDAHPRLTLLASVTIVGPALGRVPLLPIFGTDLDAARNFAIGGLLLLLAMLFAYDFVSRRKLHPATWTGAIAIVASLAGAVTLGSSAAGFNILRTLLIKAELFLV